VPIALVALVLIAAIAGSLRLVELAGGPLLLPANPARHRLARARGRAHHQRRCVRDPRRRPGWHRASGRVVVDLGLAVAFSALWMMLFYLRQPGTGELAYVFRLAFGSGMAAIHQSFARQGLVRPRKGRVLGGVCAGLGRRFGIAPWPARILFVLLLMVIPGSPILIYPILWIRMPSKETVRVEPPQTPPSPAT
jgi:phage shock protein C